MYALYAYERGYDLPNPIEVQEIINTNDIDKARQFIDKYYLIYPDNIIPE